MNIVTHAPGIIEIKNFLSDDEIEEVIKIFSDTPEENWSKDGSGQWIDRVISLDPHRSPQILHVINDRVVSLFSSFSNILPMYTLHRSNIGQAVDAHSDNTLDYKNIYGIILYINEDFCGGKIYYPGMNISYQPCAGSLLIHYAGIRHAVTEVTEGVRYFLTTFVEGTIENPAILDLESI